MKYDMHALKTLQEYEETLEPDLLALYKLTTAVRSVSSPFLLLMSDQLFVIFFNLPLWLQDDLSVELDLLSVFNAPHDERIGMLTAQLTNPADDNVTLPEGADLTPLITKIMERMDELTADCLERERTKAERKSFG